MKTTKQASRRNRITGHRLMYLVDGSLKGTINVKFNGYHETVRFDWNEAYGWLMWHTTAEVKRFCVSYIESLIKWATRN